MDDGTQRGGICGSAAAHGRAGAEGEGEAELGPVRGAASTSPRLYRSGRVDGDEVLVEGARLGLSGVRYGEAWRRFLGPRGTVVWEREKGGGEPMWRALGRATGAGGSASRAAATRGGRRATWRAPGLSPGHGLIRLVGHAEGKDWRRGGLGLLGREGERGSRAARKGKRIFLFPGI